MKAILAVKLSIAKQINDSLVQMFYLLTLSNKLLVYLANNQL